jgi:hypothetical protein
METLWPSVVLRAQNALFYLLGPSCYTTVLVYWPDGPGSAHSASLACPPALLLTRFLGLAIALVGLFLKWPVLRPLLWPTTANDRLRSASALPLTSYLLETTGLILSVVYNWRAHSPVTTYGEGPFILLQDVLITLLALLALGRLFSSSLFVVTVVALWTHCTSVPLATLKSYLILCIPIFILSMLPPILQHYRAKSTEGTPLFMLCLGLVMGLGRVVTTVADFGWDPVLVVGSLVGPVLTVVMLGQAALYYGRGKGIRSAGKRASGRAKKSN